VCFVVVFGEDCADVLKRMIKQGAPFLIAAEECWLLAHAHRYAPAQLQTNLIQHSVPHSHGIAAGGKSVNDPSKARNRLTYCSYVIYTVIAVTNQRKSWLLGPISAAADGALYQQIVDRLKREVSEGRLQPGTALPSFRQLAEDLLVSVITVKRAYEELEREGIIFRRQGLGTFVAEQGQDRSREAKLAAAKELIRNGIREATEAGLKPDEILEIASEMISKENQSYDQRH